MFIISDINITIPSRVVIATNEDNGSAIINKASTKVINESINNIM